MTLLQPLALAEEPSRTLDLVKTGLGCSGSKIVIRVHGLAKPQGSKSFKGLSKSGRAILTESSGGSRLWRNDVMLDSRRQYKGPIISEPVGLEIVFWMPRPKGHYRTGRHAGELKPNAPSWHAIAPDVDKLARCTLDGLSAKCGGCVIADDSIVVSLHCEKRYVTAVEGVGAAISLVKQ